MRANATEPAEEALEDEHALSLRQLMESLAPGELPNDPDATCYFPIDEREARTTQADPPGQERTQLSTLQQLEGQPAPESQSVRGPFSRMRTRAAELPLPRKLILLSTLALLALFALTQGRAWRARSARDASPGMAAPLARAEQGVKPVGAAKPAHAPARSGAPVSTLSSRLPVSSASSERAPELRPLQIERTGSLEQAAADRVASGDFDSALPLYRELAAAHPEQAVFTEAARILERRSGREHHGSARRSGYEPGNP